MCVWIQWSLTSAARELVVANCLLQQLLSKLELSMELNGDVLEKTLAKLALETNLEENQQQLVGQHI
jgi:hypothetical protein